MREGIVLGLESRWYCPNCDVTDVTRSTEVHTQFHQCRGMNGLAAPMIMEGTRAKVESREREDYVGKEDVQLDGEGRPIMSIVTTRDEGQDVTVFAPTARGGVN